MKTTPLRQRFIETLTIKGYSPRTLQSYVGAVYKLACYYQLSPDRLSDEQVRSFLYHLHSQTRYSRSTLNVIVNALRCFYREIVGRSLERIEFALPHPRKSQRRPQAYSVEELHQLFDRGFTSPRYRTFFMTVYGAGLRLNEACHLKVKDIDSRRRLIRIEQGKGRKDRYSILPERLLQELRSYYRLYQPQSLLFPSLRDPQRPLHDRAAQVMFKKSLRRAQLPVKGGPHTLRHSFATHLIEMGVPLHVVKRLMGHTSVTTTAGYLHISRQTLAAIPDPLEPMPWVQQALA